MRTTKQRPRAEGAVPVVIWMNMPSPYQRDFFRALSARGEVDLLVIFGEALDVARRDLGWTIQAGGFDSITLPASGRVRAALRLAWRERRRIHVVNGLWAVGPFAAASVALLAWRATVFFHAETSDPRIRRSHIRSWLRDAFGGWLLRRAHGVFAISSFAERFYLARGARTGRVFPFGYFKHHPPRPAIGVTGPEIIFVGQMIERKGVEDLFVAFTAIASDLPAARLTFVGSGELADPMRRRAAASRFATRICVVGAMRSMEIDRRIAEAAVLVLPSRFDGWGLVINEALAMGVPVVVSDACGAADLVAGAPDGIVFPTGDVAALAEAIRTVLTTPNVYRPDPNAWRGCIGVARAADYFLACLHFGLGTTAVCPVACWKRNQR